jgi:4-hydroxyproline epimerase
MHGVAIAVEGLGTVTGDVAWGGNWFFLVNDHRQELAPSKVESLTDVAWRIRQGLEAAGITGAGGAEIDHVELCTGNRNFVLCPGKAYDRSPCGTGTSAKLACLAADGKLAPGEVWRAESIVGSIFEGTYQTEGSYIRPTITGRAWVSAHGRLILDPGDPFVHGI